MRTDIEVGDIARRYQGLWVGQKQVLSIPVLTKTF